MCKYFRIKHLVTTEIHNAYQKSVTRKILPYCSAIDRSQESIHCDISQTALIVQHLDRDLKEWYTKVRMTRRTNLISTQLCMSIF